MATKVVQAGPWNMTVYTFDRGDSENPLGRLGARDLAAIPFGAVELSEDGTVLGYNDTEPGAGPGGPRLDGRNFFVDVAPWAGGSLIREEFRRGVAGGGLNVVFDCATDQATYKIRVHLKVSPILGTYWAFIKRLLRQPG